MDRPATRRGAAAEEETAHDLWIEERLRSIERITDDMQDQLANLESRLAQEISAATQRATASQAALATAQSALAAALTMVSTLQNQIAAGLSPAQLTNTIDQLTADISSAQRVAQQQAPPVVTGLSPTRGAAGTVVALSGTGLTGATGVAFGSVPGTALTPGAAPDTSLQITAPAPDPHAAAGTGVVDVVVTCPSGTSPLTTADQFAYQTTASADASADAAAATAPAATASAGATGGSGAGGTPDPNAPASNASASPASAATATPPSPTP